MTTQPQREWFETDYYKVLGVSETASDKDITKAYRKLAKENHPDSHPGREDRFKEISAAYAVLSDPEKRSAYDEVRRSGPIGGFGAGGFGAGGFRKDDIGDIFGNIFGAGTGKRGQGFRGRGGATTTTSQGPRRGLDLETSLSLGFDEAVNGLVTSVNVQGGAPCEPCNATGAAAGTSPVVCSSCGGRGVIDSNQGFFSFSQPCSACSGNGMRIEKPCPTCGGTGTAMRARQVKLRVPAGVEDGARIRVKARGGLGRNGGPPGDLFVNVHVSGHSLFGRKGKDLTLTVPVSFAEAALGATISVPTLDGPVSIRIPAGTRSGRTVRVRGKGAQLKGGSGDLLVTVDVSVPEQLTDEQRTVVESLGASLPSGASLRVKLGV